MTKCNKRRNILIVDDEIFKLKQGELLQLIEENNFEYDIVTTLEDALDKVFSEKQYDGIILDMNFPERKGEGILKKAGEKFISILEEHCIEIPILIHSIMLDSNILKYEFVLNIMCPWEKQKLQHFLNFLERGT